MKIHYWAFLVLGCLGVLLGGVGSGLIVAGAEEHGSKADVLIGCGVFLVIFAHFTLVAGCIFLAIGRGRSWLFGLLGLLAPLGLLFLCVLQDRSADQHAAKMPPTSG